MKQLFQNVQSGETTIDDVPCPNCKRGHVLVKTSRTLISAGTERMLVDFGKSNYLDKARKQPEKVKMVLDKVKSDGLLQTVDAVKSKLGQPMAMGYSNVGEVIAIGDDVTEFKIGDRVVSNGRHSEIVCVPKNLCAKIPCNIEDSDAVFTVVGSIALQGVRLTAPTIGERIVVVGLGLIGLLTVQILVANGCRVLGIDFDEKKTRLAKRYGAEVVNLSAGEDPILHAEKFSQGRGVDGVIITAATSSDEPMHQAATMCRSQGRIVLVGVVGLDLQRSDFYEKEISFRVSCSYGPGRYDPEYEDNGNDYPIGYVRWTEKRNFEAVLELIETGSIKLDDLKTSGFAFDEAAKAYEKLLESKDELGILLNYATNGISEERTVKLAQSESIPKSERSVVLGAIGAGNHAGRTLLPAFKETGARQKVIASSQGMTGTHYGKEFGYEFSTTDTGTIFNDEEINAVVIATQHDSHAKFVKEAIASKKHVFVEKPLAITAQDLDEIDQAYRKSDEDATSGKLALMVGFNRRFAPLMRSLKLALNTVSPMAIVYNCNAGFIPADSWVHDMEKGGGRIIGEACHFIDIARFLVGSPISDFSAMAMQPSQGQPQTNDTMTISLAFENGSIANINYFANGHRSFPKERVEVFQSGGIAILDNYVSLKGYGMSGIKNTRKFRQDKGINACAKAFVDGLIEDGKSPIPYEEIIEVSRVSTGIMDQISSSGQNAS